MVARDHYNWPLIARQAAELIGKGMAPTFRAISDALDIPYNTMHNAFYDKFGMRAKDLINLPKMKFGEGGKDEDSRYAGIDPKQITRLLKSESMPLGELSDHLDRGPKTVERALTQMISDGYGIVISGRVSMPEYLPADPLPTLCDEPTAAVLRWLQISDTHIGSTHAQISAVKRIVEIAYQEFGVKHVLHSGDLTAGWNMYRGQQNELYAMGADDQADAAANTLPQLKGMSYYILGGNHDYSFDKQSGHNVVKMACNLRPDWHYAGFDLAEIPMWAVKGKTRASTVLWHPSGGVPYALSYRGQKIAAEISRKELLEVVLEDKPAPTVRWVQWGHLHVSDFFPHGPMWVMGPGCFEGTNGYLKAKGLTPTIQGVIVEAHLTEKGLIQRQSLTPIQFIELENDYRTGWIPSLARRAEQLEPVFGPESRAGVRA